MIRSDQSAAGTSFTPAAGVGWDDSGLAFVSVMGLPQNGLLARVLAVVAELGENALGRYAKLLFDLCVAELLALVGR